MAKWVIFKRALLIALIALLVLTRITMVPSVKPIEEPYPANFSASVVIAKKIMEDVAQGGSSAPVAARLYAYPLLAADLPFRDANFPKSKVNIQAVSLLAGSYVFKAIHPNPFVKATAETLIRKGELMLSSADYKLSTEYAKRYSERVIKLAENDGYDKSVRSYAPPKNFSKYTWRPNGFDKQAPLESGWGSLKSISSASNSCVIELPNLKEFDEEVLSMAKVDNSIATSANVIWWLAGTGTPTPSGQWLNIAINAIKDYKIAPQEASNILAEMAVGNFDTSIRIWYYKYKFNIVRPQNLYNELTGKYFDLYRDTPNHPSYPGGHSGFSANSGSILIKHIGDKSIKDVLGEDVLVPKEARVFNSISEAIHLASQSRIDAKFHYPVDTVAGEKLGRCIAEGINIDSIAKEKALV
mgnify:CR=1 FL=1